MDLVDEVVARVVDGFYPITHQRIREMIVSMLAFQVQDREDVARMGPLEREILIGSIIERFKRSIIQEHEPVGVNAGLSVAENQTQSSLQSHHHAGVKKGAEGFDRIEELTNMKNKSNIVHVIPSPLDGAPRSKASVYELANVITKVLMTQVQIGYELVDGPHPPWYELFSLLRAIPTSVLKNRWLRIHLNPRMLYQHRIGLQTIYEVISTSIGQEGYLLYPPSTIGLYLDIHMVSQSDDYVYMRKLGTILGLQVGGIASVESASPVPENLLTNLRLIEVGISSDGVSMEYMVESKAPEFIPGYAWKRMIGAMIPDVTFIGDSGRHFRSRLSTKELEHLILGVPLTYGDALDTRNMDAEGIHLSFKQDLVNQYPYLEYADLEPRTFESNIEADRFLLEMMVEFHFFIYIEAICDTVQDLFLLPEIDPVRTYTTVPLDAKASIGYLAMRNMMYRSFRENINVDNAHLKVIINNMTLYPEPVSIKRQSIRNDRSGWMTYTTFEDVTSYLASAAFCGETDDMKSVSSHILTGQMVTIGRGGNNLKPKGPNNPTGNIFVAVKNAAEKESHRREPRKVKRTIPTTTSIPAASPGTSRAEPSLSELGL